MHKSVHSSTFEIILTKKDQKTINHICCSSVAQSCLTLHDPVDGSTSSLPVPHHLPEFAQVHVHCIGDAIQPSHPLMPSSPSALNLSQHQGLFQESAVISGNHNTGASASASVLPMSILFYLYHLFYLFLY